MESNTSLPLLVMPGLVPGIHEPWIAGSSPAMTDGWSGNQMLEPHH